MSARAIVRRVPRKPTRDRLKGVPVKITSPPPGGASAPPTPLEPGHVRIDPLDLVFLLGEDPVVVSGGFGGWEVVNRPKQVGMTLWGGVEPFTVSLPLMLDGLAEGTSVERPVRRLMRAARGDDNSEPEVVHVGGVPLPADDWVIESLDFGDPIRRNSDLALLRQPITLTLREYVPPEFVQFRRHALAPRKKQTRIVTAKKGDTVAKLARRLGVKWTTLRSLNKFIRTANQKLAQGKKVLAPVRDAKPKKKGRKH